MSVLLFWWNRTPMQWSHEPNGGFCPPDITPWLPVNPDYAAGVNVEDQVGKPESLINFYRRILMARKQHPALQVGDYHSIEVNNDQVICFSRKFEETEFLVVLNMSAENQQVMLPIRVNQIVLNNMKNWVHIEDVSPTFLPYQGLIYRAA